jgi:hypothetical protein
MTCTCAVCLALYLPRPGLSGPHSSLVLDTAPHPVKLRLLADAGGFTLLSIETYGRMSSVAHAFLKLLTDAAMPSASVGSELAVTAFRASAMRELGVART